MSDIVRKNNYTYNSFFIYIKINDDITKQRDVMINYACIEGNERCWIVYKCKEEKKEERIKRISLHLLSKLNQMC